MFSDPTFCSVAPQAPGWCPRQPLAEAFSSPLSPFAPAAPTWTASWILVFWEGSGLQEASSVQNQSSFVLFADALFGFLSWCPLALCLPIYSLECWVPPYAGWGWRLFVCTCVSPSRAGATWAQVKSLGIPDMLCPDSQRPLHAGKWAATGFEFSCIGMRLSLNVQMKNAVSRARRSLC